MSQRNVTVVTGISGTGKSVFTRRLLINGDYSYRFLFDAEASERDGCKGEFSDWLGLPPARTAFELATQLGTGTVAFDPHELFEGRLQDAVQFLCEFAYVKSAALPGNKILVIPEVWRYCKPQSIPQELANVVQSGRKRGLHLLVDTQEPNRLNSSILNGVSEFVCFKLQSGPALDCAEANGFNPDEVSQLAPFHYIGRNMDSGGELRAVVKL